MKTPARHRTPIAAWLALLSLLFFVLAPTISAAHAAGQLDLQSSICRVDKAGKPAPPASHLPALHGEHCPLCHLTAVPPLPAQPPAMPVLGGTAPLLPPAAAPLAGFSFASHAPPTGPPAASPSLRV